VSARVTDDDGSSRGTSKRVAYGLAKEIRCEIPIRDVLFHVFYFPRQTKQWLQSMLRLE